MNKLLTKIVGVVLGTTMAVGVGVGVAVNNSRDIIDSQVEASKPSNAITDYGDIVSGASYYIGASISGGDYYLGVSDSIATGVSDNGKTSKSDATVFVFTGSGTSWTVSFASNGNYLCLSSSDANGKVNVQAASSTWTLSNASNLIKMTNNGHVLQKNNNTNTTFGSYKTTSNQTNVWLEPASSSTWSVTYNGNGNTSGTAPTDATEYNSTNNTVTVLGSGNLAKEHHEFVEWNTKADGSGTGYDEDDTFTISTNTTLYAIWNQTEFVVSYNANNANYAGSTPASAVVQSGGSHTVASALSLSGYTFVSWNTSADGNGTDYAAGATISNITADITLYGIWQEAADALAGTSWTYTFTSKVFDDNNQTKMLNGTANATSNKQPWKLINNGSYYSYDSDKGQQVGSGSKPATSMTLSTTAFSGAAKISGITIATSGASSIVGTVSVAVGNVDFKCNNSTTASLTASDTSYAFTGTSSGEIVISWAQSSSKAIYFKTITVTYEIEASVVATGITVTGSQSVNGGGNATVQSTYSYSVAYEQGKAGDESNVTVSVSPAAYATVGTVSNKQFTITFKKAVSFTITVSSTETANVEGTLAVTVSNIVHVCYERLTSEVSLYSGMKLLIVDPTSSVGAGAMDDKGRLSEQSVTISENVIETNSIGSAKEFTLGGTVNNWTLTSSEGLLGTKVAKTLVYDDASATTTWTITISSAIGSEGKATIESTGADLGKILYNSSSSFFANYTSDPTAANRLPEIYIKTAENNVYGMIESTMRMGDTALAGNGSDACKNSGYYLAAKVALSKLSQSERNSFRDDDNSKYTAALARYNAWARANHDANPFDGKDEIASANSLFGNTITNSTAVVATVIIISVISLSTLCGYFLLRKRKEER
jgi:hypothetical protein